MNKKGKKCNLVQMDISDVITKWRNFEKIKKSGKKVHTFRSTLVIEMLDSDSESEGYIDYLAKIDKRELAFPFSQDNEEYITSMQKTDSLESATVTPSKLVNIGVNNPKSNPQLTHPEACSTPLKLSQSSVNNSYVGIQDLSFIEKNGNKTYSDSGLVSDTDSERTVIYQESPNKSINIIEHRIIPKINNSNCANYSSNVTRLVDESISTHDITQKGPDNTLAPSPIREGAAKEETVSKKRKVDPLNKEKRNSCKKLFDEKKSESLPNSSIDKENLNSSKNYNAISQTNCSKRSEERSINTNTKREMESCDEKVTKKQKVVERKKSAIEECKENESVQSTKVNIVATAKEQSGDKQPEQSTKITPNHHKGKTLLKSMEEKQTLNRSASEPSCSTDGHASSSSPGKTKVEAKTEGKQMNVKYVTLIQELFNTVYETNNINNLLGEDKKVVDLYRDMNTNYQYVCVKLFTWQRKWYNIYKFCNRINLNIGDSNISEMYNFFKEKGIVDTDFAKDDVRKLLELLDPNDLKSIRNTFKLKKTLVNKQDIINSLLRCCSTQSTLTPKSTLSILMEEIEHKLGYSIRLNENFHDAFYRTYVLATYANPVFTKMTDYFKNVLHLRIAFPEYSVENYTVFYTKDEFIRYAKARKYKDGLEDVLGRNHLESLQICKSIFEELRKTKNDGNDYEARYRNAPHLVRFTARAVYVSALSSAVKILATKFPTDVKEWLEYMIKELNFPHRIGEWYYHLSWLYMNYLEPRDYTHAAKLIIEVLQEKREHLSEVQLHQLGKRGQALKVTKKYKIDQLYHDTIVELVPEPIDINGFPSITVDASTIRSNELGKKRDYFFLDKDGNKTVSSVEYIALKYYLENGYTDGEHCEGSLIVATFTLFFWDIIYSAREIIPGAFVSKLQSEPLDMSSKHFYLNRKNAIDKRLEEIETTWSDSDLIKFAKDNYEKYSHLEALCRVEAFIKNVEMLQILIDCVGRLVLAKIYKRFVKNIRHYRSGLPDLLIWNVHDKKSKFVEVKGENDKLSLGQTLWINYLLSIGADVEVCKVHSIGSKRKKIQKPEDKMSAEPTTSSSSVASKGKKKGRKVEEKPSMEASTSSSCGPKSKNIPKLENKMSMESSTSSLVISKGKRKVQKMEASASSPSDGSKRKKSIQKAKEDLSEESSALSSGDEFD